MDKPLPIDLNRADAWTVEAQDAVNDLFAYHPWDEDQKQRGESVRATLAQAYLTIIANVPPCPTRTVALRQLTEVRMMANSAITHRGRY